MKIHINIYVLLLSTIIDYYWLIYMILKTRVENVSLKRTIRTGNRVIRNTINLLLNKKED